MWWSAAMASLFMTHQTLEPEDTTNCGGLQICTLAPSIELKQLQIHYNVGKLPDGLK